MIGLRCAKFAHSFSPIDFYVLTISLFSGSVWSVVRDSWDFDVVFICGHVLAPISMGFSELVVFWSHSLAECW